MEYGYVKIALATPKISVCDTVSNAKAIAEDILSAYSSGAEIIVFPELCLTGATAGDLIFNDTLLSGAEKALEYIKEKTKNVGAISFIGMPVKAEGLIYNAAVCIQYGKILGIVPKTNLTVGNDGRFFAPAPETAKEIDFAGEKEVLLSNAIFVADNKRNFTVGVEIGSDMFSAVSPSCYYASDGANIIVNLFAMPETVKMKDNISSFAANLSKKLCVTYAVCSAGDGESTTDGVFAGHRIVAENGKIEYVSEPFTTGISYFEADTGACSYKKSRFSKDISLSGYAEKMYFTAEENNGKCTRVYSKYPFIPSDINEVESRCEYVLRIQAEGLKKRILAAKADKIVIGLSGGLDSALALLVSVKAFNLLNRNLKDIIAITMPCFGTSGRTFDNSCRLAKAAKVSFKKVDISKAVTRHLKDIGHKEGVYDAAYENAQARERTQVLMDVANSCNGIVVGTGDLSELALGWCTYNGDHMSMYAVNCSVTKTLARCILSSYAKKSGAKMKAVLESILDTPVSPELLPSKDEEFSQKTEEIVGPYELHDYFLYYMISCGFTPKKLFVTAVNTFKGEFNEKTIVKWLKLFIKRFYTQQFKRSCSPDGVKTGSVNLSPRGELVMPSDASLNIYLNEIKEIEDNLIK